MNERRAGKFSIATDLIEISPAAITRVMGMCIILRAEHNYLRRRIDYEAICWRFRAVAEGEMFPEYEWLVGPDDVECVEKYDISIHAPATCIERAGK